MADISQIKLPNGTTYNIKDANARKRIEALESFTTYLGVTTTALTDGATTNPITINNQNVTAQSGNIVLYGNQEFIFDGTHWNQFGDLSALGALAYKNTASGSYTPAGTVEAPTISVKTAGSTTTVNSITNVGTLPTYTVSGEVLTLTQGKLPTKGSNQTVKTGDAAYQATAPKFTGTTGSVTVS